MKRIIFIFLFALSGINLNAQMNLDSLFLVWQDESLKDSLRTDAYFDYINIGFLYNNPDSALIMHEELTLFTQEKHFLFTSKN